MHSRPTLTRAVAPQDHTRRRNRVEGFLTSDEGIVLAANYDLEGVVALLDDRAEAERPPRPPPKKPRRAGGAGEGEGKKKRQRVGKKLGKKERLALKA